MNTPPASSFAHLLQERLRTAESKLTRTMHELEELQGGLRRLEDRNGLLEKVARVNNEPFASGLCEVCLGCVVPSISRCFSV